MFQNLLTKVIGNRNQRMLKKMQRTVQAINEMEVELQALSDEQIAAKTDEFKQRIAKGESLDSLALEAFAVVREASVRVLGMRHFDVQLIAGLVLNQGKIAEMKTGEGKTLMATAPAYLNALTGQPVHVVTVNDYLANRDANWMGQVYQFLGLSVGVIMSGQERELKQQAYACDIVYGTNNEFGFDYLRDNMAFSADDRVQRGLGFAIIDEVDSILIDEARTPLIISGAAEGSTEMYQRMNQVVPKLVPQEEEDGPGDFSIDEKSKQISLTESGHEHAEQLLTEAGMLQQGASLYNVSNINLMHHLIAALRAHHLFNKDVDYIVNNDQVVIIDEFTGRMMSGRRWSDGLHQAVEAKEGVTVQQENQTMASITFQNYFRVYDKLSGMTGTADTEAPEFMQIYGLEVVILPTNRPMKRDDHPDLIYRTIDEKFEAIRKEIIACRENNQPVLVGTASIDSSERLSELLKQAKIPHQILNAKQHEREAQIIAEAGRPGTVTIATNMAGRGTDIVLGGNLELVLEGVEDFAEREKLKIEWQQRHDTVIQAGGLHVLGTERNESRRIDNQLRGRCGRQGDPGSSRFYLSLEDTLMRIFGSERIGGMMQRLGMEENEAIEHPWVSKAIENAQKKVEGHNFDMRKQLLEYDDVANEQRKVVYEQRNQLMDTDNVSEFIVQTREEVVDSLISQHVPPQSVAEQWDIEGLEDKLQRDFGIELPIARWLDEDDKLYEEPLRDRIHEAISSHMQVREERTGEKAMRHFEKAVMLQVLDSQWKEHLANMDYLRQGIGLRGYAQKNPKQEYKREAFQMFTLMFDNIKFEVISILSRFHIPTQEELVQMEQQQRVRRQQELEQSKTSSAQSQEDGTPERPFVREIQKIGRNQPCPCGSGKKYKQCHGKIA